jgi:pyruvate kinase
VPGTNAIALAPSGTAEADASLPDVAIQLAQLEQELRQLEHSMQESIEGVPIGHRESAKNLVHYMALRQHDLRELQQQLARLGLSSLGRSESCVLGAVLEVAMRVRESLAQQGHGDGPAELSRLGEAREAVMSWAAARSCLQQHTRDIFGPRPADRHIYVMVTAPSAKEADLAWMVMLLGAGMNVLRINCAHEGEKEWQAVVEALAQARQTTGLACRVIMDLAGPKIRTGAIKPERPIATWKPVRNEIGMPITEARVVVRRASAAPCEGTPASLILADDEFAELRKGDELRFRDVRGKKRSLTIEATEPDRLVALASQRAYVRVRTRARLYRKKGRKGHMMLEVGEAAEAVIDVRSGDSLVLTTRECMGSPPTRDDDGGIETPGVIPCTLPAALAQLKVGHRVLFDDGRIHTTVERIEQASGDFFVRVNRTQKRIAKLRGEKGINLPDTAVAVPGFTEEDRRALAFVVKHADAVSLSFVRSAGDVRALHEELDRLDQPAGKLGIILKIETRAGFESLPRLLLEGLRRPPLAIMIARGDLAVEVGFERLAELQEEMLWFCEACHVPAIWATQVLDTLARTGVPSRAEVTDAAESVAAECVMLNKGPYVAEAVSVLADILRRMEKHRDKKRSLFRKLEVSTFTER